MRLLHLNLVLVVLAFLFKSCALDTCNSVVCVDAEVCVDGYCQCLECGEYQTCVDGSCQCIDYRKGENCQEFDGFYFAPSTEKVFGRVNTIQEDERSLRIETESSSNENDDRLVTISYENLPDFVNIILLSNSSNFRVFEMGQSSKYLVRVVDPPLSGEEYEFFIVGTLPNGEQSKLKISLEIL